MPLFKKKKLFSNRRPYWSNMTAVSRAILFALLLSVLVGGIVGSVYGIKRWMRSCPYFFVSSIEVIGEERLTEQDIIKMSGVKEGDNIFAIDLAKVAERLYGEPWIRSVDIERRLPDALVIHLQERVPVALARVGSKIYMVDRDGTPFKPLDPGEEFSAPVITGVDAEVPEPGRGRFPAVDHARMSDALKIIKMSRRGVRALGFNNISEINFPDDETVVIYTADRGVPFYIDRKDLKRQYYRAEKILFQLYNSGEYPKVLSVDVGYGEDMALARLKKKK